MSHFLFSDVAWIDCLKMFCLPDYFGGQCQFVEIKNLQEYIHFNNFLMWKSLSGSGWTICKQTEKGKKTGSLC